MQAKINTFDGAVEQQACLSVSDFDQALNDALSALSVNSFIEQESLDQLQHARQHVLPNMFASLSSGNGQTKNILWSGWGWQSIISTPELRIGLLEIHKNKSIPIHDHPGACGTLIVLKGNLEVSIYQSNSNQQTGETGFAVLSKQHRQIVKEKESAIITETEGNIHSLASMTDTCIVLDILLRPYDERLRTWYMPVVGQPSGKNSFSCFRMNNKRFLNKG